MYAVYGVAFVLAVQISLALVKGTLDALGNLVSSVLPYVYAFVAAVAIKLSADAYLSYASLSPPLQKLVMLG